MGKRGLRPCAFAAAMWRQTTLPSATNLHNWAYPRPEQLFFCDEPPYLCFKEDGRRTL